ncbi:hypothetical protein EOD39_20769 [Acipenser ruthenus]|uniref:Ubl4 C-terminal TUGS domain-containing protein n=1 Tax=Acipenser ruthenus TaxID=7906 RepID=A0A444UUJ1_ACIRT|nr:hypothetical protein EOD39_20769 [Acipenser ruthenus]
MHCDPPGQYVSGIPFTGAPEIHQVSMGSRDPPGQYVSGIPFTGAPEIHQDYEWRLRLLNLDDLEQLATRMLHPGAVKCMELSFLD